jgi:hypothetical protein
MRYYDDVQLRDFFRREIYRDPRRAIAVAVTPITDLWVAVLEAYGHPNIGPEQAQKLHQWMAAIVNGVHEAVTAAACEMRLRSGVWPAQSLSKEEPARRKPRQRG